jgi:hypothetical protein
VTWKEKAEAGMAAALSALATAARQAVRAKVRLSLPSGSP